ncbi:MAG TPA: hypothetical protein EYH03_00060 [Chromatiales bacterium]|nr:hypothetical protein [Chromatiales bacterium]
MDIPGKPHRSAGATLVELTSALAVSATLLTVGIPAYQKLTAENRLASEVNLFLRHIHLGRSTATKTDQQAILCPSTDGRECSPHPAWGLGYMVYIDQNENRRADPNEPVLRQHIPQHARIAITSSVHRKRILFQRDGSTPGSNPTLVFCDPTGHAPPRAVIVSNTGRPRVSNTRPNGTPLTCK